MTRTDQLPDRVAANVRAEMAVQRKTAVELGVVLGIGHRAALRRVNGEQPFSLGELEKVAVWLGVTIASLMFERSLPEQAVALEAVAS